MSILNKLFGQKPRTVAPGKIPRFKVTLDGIPFEGCHYEIYPISGSAKAGDGGEGFIAGGSGGNAMSLSIGTPTFSARVYDWSTDDFQKHLNWLANSQAYGNYSDESIRMFSLAAMICRNNLVVEMNCTTYKVVKAQ